MEVEVSMAQLGFPNSPTPLTFYQYFFKVRLNLIYVIATLIFFLKCKLHSSPSRFDQMIITLKSEQKERVSPMGFEI